MPDSRSHSSLILVLSKDGVPLVFEPSKPLPHYWKLPGGKKDNDETPLQTATRELEEELGPKVGPQDLTLLTVQDKGSHDLYLYCVIREDLNDLKERGDEGEEIGVFKCEKLEYMVDFLPYHRKLLLLEEVKKRLMLLCAR